MSLVTVVFTVLAGWCVAGFGVALLAGRSLRLAGAIDEVSVVERDDASHAPNEQPSEGGVIVPDRALQAQPMTDSPESRPLRVLVVDDDAGLRALLRTTFEIADLRVEEAESAVAATELIPRTEPDVVVLDVAMPGLDGLSFCRALKDDPLTQHIAVVLLTGAEEGTEQAADAAGADGFVRKPFSPLALLDVIEGLTGRRGAAPSQPVATADGEQLMLYARDLGLLLEIERAQRKLLQAAYRETVTTLAGALEAKDMGTSDHSKRVQRYALELTKTIDPRLLTNETLEYGFLLHDVGKIGIPDHLLWTPPPLSDSERRTLETHPVLGEQMLAGAALLRGEGLRVVRSHHERWDGRGYPDGLDGEDIPIGARIFAVADSLDAMTTDRPYRRARSWEVAAEEIIREAGRQFDPDVVDAFRDCQAELLEVKHELQAV
jgi:response regulator RpfG family c-di-GMP phosphodiesterase